MVNRLKSLAICLAVLSLASCIDPFPISKEDPLELPPEIEANKDLSVKPGDSFFDYCNGSWLKSHPIPATGSIGGLYDADAVMAQRIEQLKSSSPDIGRFYGLMDSMHDQPEKSRTFLDAQKARFPKPSTKEDAYQTLGKMLMDGNLLWSNALMSAFDLTWKDGRLVGILLPPISIPNIPIDINPETLVPISATKAGDLDPLVLMVRGMGLDPSLFYKDPAMEAFWTKLKEMSLDEICKLMSDSWEYYEAFVSQEQMEKVNSTKKQALANARSSLNYTLSYHLAEKFLPPAFKERYMGITREIQAALRNRIQSVDWMSGATRSKAVEKLDNCSLYVAYPDEWHTDCVGQLADCETLVEAVYLNNRGMMHLKGQLIGGTDRFSNQILKTLLDSSYEPATADLTMINAMYLPNENCVYIYPAMLLPPILPENISDAYAYAAFTIIGHEFTHGFDTDGAKYDKDGNKRNWWTVADMMEFEKRRQNIIDCYSHMEMDPKRAPGVYGDGVRTQTENIADLGGFLTVLDAYKARLEEDGYFGKVYYDQLRKFYECYAHIWCVEYGDGKFSVLEKTDVHSHARLRVNGVVMNTDLWYELYDVDRNNYLYLPKERRTYIW